MAEESEMMECGNGSEKNYGRRRKEPKRCRKHVEQH
jgi:hypothetical protein